MGGQTGEGDLCIRPQFPQFDFPHRAIRNNPSLSYENYLKEVGKKTGSRNPKGNPRGERVYQMRKRRLD
jgi:hypothetical protein